jgi:nucleotide-binding universal stress UspA family protein
MYTRIAVAVDGSKASNLAWNEAIGLAATPGAKLLLIHIMDDVVLRWGEAGWVDHGSVWRRPCAGAVRRSSTMPWQRCAAPVWRPRSPW